MRDRPKDEVLDEHPAKADAAPGHERHHRPADLAPHRPHAVGHAGQHRRQDLRRRSADAARAGAAGARPMQPASPAWSTSRPSSRPTSRRVRVQVRPRGARPPRAAGRRRGAKRCETAVVGRDGRARCSRRRSRSRWSCATTAPTVERPRARSATPLVDTPGGAQVPLARLARHPRGPRPELHQPRERPAQDRRPVQRRRPRPAQRRRRHPDARGGPAVALPGRLPRRVRRAVRERGRRLAAPAVGWASRRHRDLLHADDRRSARRATRCSSWSTCRWR